MKLQNAEDTRFEIAIYLFLLDGSCVVKVGRSRTFEHCLCYLAEVAFFFVLLLFDTSVE